MDTRRFIHNLWLMCFVASVALLSFSQTYSQILLGVALPFFVIDNFIYQRFTLSKFENKLYIIIALFLVLEIVSALSNSTPLKSLWALREEWLFLLLPVSLRAFRERTFHSPLLKTIVFSALTLAVYGVIQHYTGVTIFRPGQELYQSTDGLFITPGNFHNTLSFGNYMAVSAMFIFTLSVFFPQKNFRLLCLPIGAIAAVVTFFSYQRGSVLGLLIGAVALMVLCYRRRIASIAVLFGVIIITGALLAPRVVERFKESFQREIANAEMSDRDYSLRRTTIWGGSLKIIAANPVFGVGASNFQRAYQHYADSSVVLSFSHAHNDLLNIASYSGIPAVIVYGLFWLHLLRALFRRHRQMGSDSSVHMALTATLVASITFLGVSLTEVAFAKEALRSALMIFWGYGLWGIEQADRGDQTALTSASGDSSGVRLFSG